MNASVGSRGCLSAFVVLELVLSIPFWGIGALATMGVIPDQVDLLHPGFFVWWYLWPVNGTGLSVPSFYDPRNLALTAAALGLVATIGWGARTLSLNRFARLGLLTRGDSTQARGTT